MRYLLAASLVMFGCAHHAQVKNTALPIPRATLASRGAGLGAASDDGAPRRADTLAAELARCGDVRVHFDFDSFLLSNAERLRLGRSADCLREDRALHITVQGNADERGTEEYNLALGDRRAQAVASYLASLGATEAQLKTVSYGKENPLCTEHDEACWSVNRRAELKLAVTR